jgi:transcriptional regulator with XRE-family HTH domain
MILYTDSLLLYNILYVMKPKKISLLPKIEKILSETGENIKLARLRRKLGAEQVAERANISRMTLFYIEKGKEGVSMGAYAQVLFVLGLEKDLLKLAGDDPLGRKLQDANLLVKERAPKKKSK